MSSYAYLFPFEKIQKGSRIVIYGAGILGQEYLKQILLTDYCTITAFVDKNAERYSELPFSCITPEHIHEMGFDYVVVAIRVETFYNEIKRILTAEGVSEDRIICVFERDESGLEIKPDRKYSECDSIHKTIVHSYEKDSYSIAFMSSGGIGDMISHKKFITEIIRLFDTCSTDIYTARNAEFIRNLYSDIPQIMNVIDDAGISYGKECENYSLSITINAMSFIRVDYFDKALYADSNSEVVRTIECLGKASRDDGYDIKTLYHIPYVRRIYNSESCFTYLSYGGLLNINDSKVTIPLMPQYAERFRKLGLGERYITFNFGNGDSFDISRISKSWPLEYFDRTIELIKMQFPGLLVVQLGAHEAKKSLQADKYVLGHELSEVCHILKHSLLHIDIDGGLVHIATQLGTKCIVLFGPTSEEYLGYEQNINIRSGVCGGCYGLYPDNNKCAKGMKKPECMYSIKPEVVAEKAVKWLKLML